MKKNPLCFVISPIGEVGSDTRRDADDLLDIIIRPALEVFGFDIIRGDHRSEANQIDVDVIKSVQEAELCIADIGKENVNVYYEVGRRDETGKPLILLKSKNTGILPVDIATRRYIEYDLDSRQGIRDAQQQLRNFVKPLVEAQFENSAGSSLSDIAAILQRVERKLDRVMKGGTISAGGASSAATATSLPAGSDPKDVFKVALRQNNIPLIEECLDRLRMSMDLWKFLDLYAEPAASRGSVKAGELLIEHASAFIDDISLTFHQKTDYLSYLVSFGNKTDREQELLPLVEDIATRLLGASAGAEDAQIAEIYNQQNRLYYGIYINTKDESWLEKAISMLKQAQKYVPNESFIYYNLSTCYMYLSGGLEEARACIDRSLEIDKSKGKEDDSHLKTAYRIYKMQDDPGAGDILERLRAIDPYKAMALENS